jgi:apolipoprotein N-acyltransferase
VNRFVDYCILASGSRRLALAFLAGALAALAMPPVGFFPILFISLPVAVWLLDGCVGSKAGVAGAFRQSLLQAAWVGWLWGFGYHLAGLWWLGAAFLVDADRFLWALPLGVVGLPAGLALFTAFGFALARLFWRPGLSRIFWFAAALAASEYVRGHVLTGFPWNALGMALGDHLLFAQVASVVGLHGLTLLAVLVGALPACAFDFRDGRGLRLTPLAGAALILALLAAFGILRLPYNPSPVVAGVRLRIMQPNIPQSAHYDAQGAMDLVKGYLDLSDRATSPTTNGLAAVTHLVWPESPFPFPLAREPRALEMIGNVLGGHTVLMTGGVRAEPDGPGSFRAFNSLFVIDRGGRILDSYDKVHLVPFGEYLPLGNLLRRAGLRHFVDIPGGFEPGSQRRPVAVPGLPPVQPLICYEAIFPGEVVASPASLAQRPGVMVNITNDAWFGRTAGPYQHFAQARLRSIEEGIPMVRAANSGISAVVDPYGRITAELGLGATGVLDATLPQAIGPTLFARYGSLLFLAMWLATLGIALFLSLRRPAKTAF